MPSKSKNTQTRKKSKPSEPRHDPKSGDSKTKNNAKKSKKPVKPDRGKETEPESTNTSNKNQKQKKTTTSKNQTTEKASDEKKGKMKGFLQVMMTGPKDQPTKSRAPTTPTTTPPPAGTPRKTKTPERCDKVEEVLPTTPGVSPLLPTPPAPKQQPVVISKEASTPPGKVRGGTEPILKAVSKASDTPSADAFTTATTTTTTGTGNTTGTTTTTSAVSVNEKWSAEPIAQRWLEKIDFSKVKLEYESLQKMSVDVEKDCKKWKANAKLNQPDGHPALDVNLIKHETGDYVNMNFVEVPLRRNVYIGQIPVKGSEETFWKAFFDARVTYMTVLHEGPVEFFPNDVNDFRHFGAMFVNNRKVEVINEDVTRFVIEVLPAGCSNSNLCTITVIKNWLAESVHAKQAVVIKEILEMSVHMNTAPPDETDAIVSRRGAGRAGYFAALMVAVTRLDQKTEPNIAEIVKSIRAQRPKAVDTLTQYVSLYISIFYYIKRKSNTGELDKKDDTLGKRCNQLTQAFTQALVTEIAANVGRSTITLLPMVK